MNACAGYGEGAGVTNQVHANGEGETNDRVGLGGSLRTTRKPILSKFIYFVYYLGLLLKII